MKGQNILYKEGWNLKTGQKESLIFSLRRAIHERRFMPAASKYLNNKFKIFNIHFVHFLFSFRIDGKRFRYFTHKYNAVETERTVEIPWVLSLMDFRENILEVGNVLSHYVKFPHTVVDKYEKSPGIVNEDAENFVTDAKYDCIVSISTLEHIGYDEEVKDSSKILRTITNLKGMIKEGGKMIITVPLVYNPYIDDMIKSNSQNFSKVVFLERISNWNLWKQCTIDKAMKLKYGSKYPFANSVAFLIFENLNSATF